MGSPSVTSFSYVLQHPLRSQRGELQAIQANLFLSFCPTERTAGVVGGLPDLWNVGYHVDKANNLGIVARLSNHGTCATQKFYPAVLTQCNTVTC